MRVITRMVLVSTVWAITLTPAFGQEDEGIAELKRVRDEPQPGFWPTQRMVDGILMRIVDDMERDYGFDFEQKEMALELLQDYIPRFMNENRAEIQELTNMYFEAILNDQPPTPEEVASWAQRVMPLMDEFRSMGETMAEDMRGFLTEEQAIKLEGNLEAFRTGMEIGTTRMKGWADGNYDPVTEWYRNPDFEKQETERAKAAEKKMLAARDEAIERTRLERGLGTPETAQPTEPVVTHAPPAVQPDSNRTRSTAAAAPPDAQKDEWEAYVEQFCKRYSLTEDQRQTAQRYLRGRQQERDRIKLRIADKLERIQKLFAEAKTPADVKKAEEELKKVNAPIERTFERLKQQLDKLPTPTQRRAAEPAGKPAEAAKKDAPPAPVTAGGGR